MRVLAITNMYPSERNQTSGRFLAEQVRSLEALGITMKVVHIARDEVGKRAYLGSQAIVASEIAAFAPDLVHSLYGGVLSCTTLWAARGLPTVVSFCGSDLLGRSLGAFAPRVSGAVGVYASHLSARFATRVIVKSQNLYDALPRAIDRSKVTIIPNGVDLAKFRPLDRAECRRKLGWRAEGFHVVVAGYLGESPGKRLDLARCAVAAARRQGLDAEVQVLAGVAHAEVPVWLNAASAVLLTSVHEGSPNIIKEALACNAPVVSVAVGDVPLRLSGVVGSYLADETPEGIAARLMDVHRNGSVSDGRKNIEALSLPRIAGEVHAVYQAALAAGPARRAA